MRGQRHAPAALYPGKVPVPIVQEAGWVPGPVWTGEENLALTGIRSPDRQARRQSLYRLSYPVNNKRRYSVLKIMQMKLKTYTIIQNITYLGDEVYIGKIMLHLSGM